MDEKRGNIKHILWFILEKLTAGDQIVLRINGKISIINVTEMNVEILGPLKEQLAEV